MEHVTVNCGLLMDGQSRILMALRYADAKICASAWEIPGGKKKDGEDDRECVKRELLEETGLRVDVYDLLASETHCWREHGLMATVNLYRCTVIDEDEKKEPRPLTSQRIGWFTLDEARKLDPVTPSTPGFLRSIVSDYTYFFP